MDTQAKQDFINDFYERMRRDMLAKVAKMPWNWDGNEIRALAAMDFGYEVTSTMRQKRTKRFKEFRNTVICKNL